MHYLLIVKLREQNNVPNVLNTASSENMSKELLLYITKTESCEKLIKK